MLPMRLDDGGGSVPVTVRRWLGTLAKPCFKLIPATNCFWIRYKWKSQKAEKEHQQDDMLLDGLGDLASLG